MMIDANFDGGNIEVITADSSDEIQLKIHRDKHADYRQWFYFRATKLEGKNYRFRLINAGQASYPEAWDGGSIVASYNRRDWFRIPTRFDGDHLCFTLFAEQEIAYFALFPPYSYERHLDLIAKSLQDAGCKLYDVVQTVEGRQVELLRVGTPETDKKRIWIIARQHPAETMAEWFMEGLLQRLLETDDTVTKSVLETSVFYLVPNMNPDGSVAGNLRSNGAGIDLNRAWLEPSPDTSPEVCFVLNHMKDIGVDLFLDIHGDEEIPYVFPTACEGNPGYTSRITKLEQAFYQAYQQANSDFQAVHGYPKDEPGKADLSIACNQIGERFDCLSVTIEMPFKDNANAPDPVAGWSIDRSVSLGGSALDAIAPVLGSL